MTNTMRHWLAERLHRCYCDGCNNKTGEINTYIYTDQGGKTSKITARVEMKFVR